MKKEFIVDSSIYDDVILHQMITDFKEVASIEFLGNILTIEGDSPEEIDECFNESMNYCIWLIND